MLLQRKNDSRDASSTSLMRAARGRAASAGTVERCGRAAAAAGSRSTRKRKLGLTSTPLERPLDARFEAPVRTPRLVERHQHLQIGVGDRPAVGAPRERGEDLRARTRFLRRRASGGTRRAGGATRCRRARRWSAAP